jgi:hypothetical protein
MSLRRAATAVLLVAAAAAAHSQVLINQGFDNVPGLAATWPQADTSSPSVQPWFQGNAGIFSSQAGAANSYIAIDPVTATGDFANSVSRYLMTPVFSLATSTQLSFWARSTGIADGFPDRLQVLLSTAGSSTSVASFSSVLLDTSTIGNAWTLESLLIGAQGAAATGRLAFRYFIPDTSAAGDYLGIDTLSVTAVPEPSVVASMLMGFGALSLAISRRKNRRAASKRQ